MIEPETKTIFALSTVPGRSGIAVVRVSGPRAGIVVDAVAGARPAPRVSTLRTLRDGANGEKIDQGLVLWLPGPKSFTGEDCAEFHLHGGPAVIKALLATLAAQPHCRFAEAGEFSRRAFENCKLDLAEVEGVADLIAAETEAQRRQALRQAGGALSMLYEHWRTTLIRAAALTEAALDFSDESDVSAEALANARSEIQHLLPEIQRHLDDGHRGEILRDGFQVVIAGPPNVGKSSLLNALARRDVAIVSEHAGTTRDVIEVHLDLEGFPVIVSDTAGVRSDAGDIEQEGIARARAKAENAHLVLWLSDDPGALSEPETIAPGPPKTLKILSKSDLHAADKVASRSARLCISAKTGAGMEALIAAIAAEAGNRMSDETEAPVLTQARHRLAVEQCAANLEAYLAGSSYDAELRAEDLRAAISALGRITGRVDVEDILDQVFGRFCIGK